MNATIHSYIKEKGVHKAARELLKAIREEQKKREFDAPFRFENIRSLENYVKKYG